MAQNITTPTSGFPGPVNLGAVVTSATLFNDMNIQLPDFVPELFDRYGDEGQYGMMVMEFNNAYGGAFRSIVEAGTSNTQEFQHFEKGRAFASGTVNADVAAATNATITVKLGTGSYYNSGTECAFREKEYGFIGSTRVKFRVLSVTKNGANDIDLSIQPVETGTSLASAGQSSIKAGEFLGLVGNQAAGEKSTKMDSQNSFIYRISNTIATIRDDYSISDVGKMEKTQVQFKGGSHSYYEFGQTELNKRFMYYIQDLCFEGVTPDNVSSTPNGTTGVIPTVEAAAPEIQYTIGNMTLSDLLALARVWEYNGGPAEYHILQETNQQDDVDTLLFGKYNNGAIRYASAGGEERLAVQFGFKSFYAKNKTMHFYNYKPFSIPTIYGKMPTLGDARQFYGLCIAQGVTPDAKSGTLAPNMQWVYQEPMPGVRFLTYESGGMAAQNKTTTLDITLTQAVYVGARIKAPQQFATFVGSY